VQRLYSDAADENSGDRCRRVLPQTAALDTDTNMTAPAASTLSDVAAASATDGAEGDFVIIAVGLPSTEFIISRGLLTLHPSTMLGAMFKTADSGVLSWKPKIKYSFPDRDPDCFRAILAFYKSGILRQPTGIDSGMWCFELDSWGITPALPSVLTEEQARVTQERAADASSALADRLQPLLRNAACGCAPAAQFIAPVPDARWCAAAEALAYSLAVAALAAQAGGRDGVLVQPRPTRDADDGFASSRSSRGADLEQLASDNESFCEGLVTSLRDKPWGDVSAEFPPSAVDEAFGAGTFSITATLLGTAVGDAGGGGVGECSQAVSRVFLEGRVTRCAGDAYSDARYRMLRNLQAHSTSCLRQARQRLQKRMATPGVFERIAAVGSARPHDAGSGPEPAEAAVRAFSSLLSAESTPQQRQALVITLLAESAIRLSLSYRRSNALANCQLAQHLLLREMSRSGFRCELASSLVPTKRPSDMLPDVDGAPAWLTSWDDALGYTGTDSTGYYTSTGRCLRVLRIDLTTSMIAS